MIEECMSDYRSRWIDELIRQGRPAAEIEQARREQQRIQASLPDLSEEEAQLVSLLRMGVRICLEWQPLSPGVHKKGLSLFTVGSIDIRR
jgi:hypothetical protein